ncbi:FG-GAP-like repeat-containing protein [Nocardioides sp.]|uniref:FG-GAP-like repeat-containing protein n=1 Tax=Nocardioides sp. TaxID=35761 RepID=UPI0037836015
MPASKIRFITGCQQLLALAVVLAALTPAASVVSLDVVQSPSDAGSATGTRGALAAYVRAATTPAKVPTEVVDPTVHEYPLTTPAGRRTVAGSVTSVVSRPEPVVGYGAVGVTWAHGAEVATDDITLQVRTRTGDAWSGWMPIGYDPEHGPDPGSAEARHARPGTDALLVGDVDDVQVRVQTAHTGLPADLRLSVVDPGRAAHSAYEKPALDTTTMDGTPGDAVAAAGAPASLATDAGEGTDGTDRIDLSAATYTPRPQIFSRAQWGADESMREKSSLHYGEVHAGFVHHTVNANDYTRAEVPALLRSIYAYHTQSRGWSDIGYNYLVDRFGRIWEGRYGGIDRPVVGAHTLNYNDYSFAMSAIGNYDIKQPSQAMVQAYGALFAWKLSLHGVDASSTKQWVGSRYFQAINGHRDAAATACPGRYLYARIPQIRQLAAAAQRGWSGRQLESNLAGSAYPDLVVRRASDGKGFIIPTGGLTGFGAPVRALTGLVGGQRVVVTPDVSGDGVGDLVVLSSDGSAQVRLGDGKGGFGPAVRTTSAFAGHDLLTAVGDVDGDGRNDLVARSTATGRLDLYLGRSRERFALQRLGTGWSTYTSLIGAGDLDGDGRADLLARASDGTMWRFTSTGKGGFGGKTRVAGSWSAYSNVVGIGDFDKDGDPDLFARSKSTKQGYVLPSRGDGTYGHPFGPIPRIAGVGSLLGAAQLTGDATPDVVGRTGRTLVVYPNNGTVETGAPIPTGMNLSNANLVLNAGDWDRDGFGDVIIRSKASGALYLRRGDGTGHFATGVRIGTGFAGVGLLAAVGDMTGDGWPDLMGEPRGGDMRIYPGAGLRGLRPSYEAHSRIVAGRQVAVGRWDGDGAPDSLLRSGNRLTLYPGNGPGGLTSPRSMSVDVSPYDWVIGVSDVQLRGHADVIVRDRASGSLWVLPGTTSGFGTRRFLAGGMGGYDLAG